MTLQNIQIPSIIDYQEILVRCIGNDLYYCTKKQRLVSTAFLPPPGRNDVSLLRLNYTDLTSCKAHAKTIKKGNYNYLGLSLTLCEDLWVKSENEPDKFNTSVISTPLNEEKQYVRCEKAYTSDKGLPFHADLIYHNWTLEEGRSAPNSIKKIAKKLVQMPPTTFFNDNNIDSEEFHNMDVKKFLQQLINKKNGQ